MDREFGLLHIVLPTSGCAKKQVAAGTYANGKFVWSVNTCEYEGVTCPRLGLPSGDGYGLCKALHAEARLVKVMKFFSLNSDGIAWVLGHYWACEPCASALKSVGVKEIRVRESE